MQAKKLLKRIEKRDLYKFSAMKKIPKYCPQTDFMDRSHQAYCICKCCACMLKNDAEVRAAKKMHKERCERKHFEESIFEKLSIEEQRRIKSKSNICVEVQNYLFCHLLLLSFVYNYTRWPRSSIFPKKIVIHLIKCFSSKGKNILKFFAKKMLEAKYGYYIISNNNYYLIIIIIPYIHAGINGFDTTGIH